MPTLLEKLPLPDKRPAILDDCVKLLDSEVARRKGMSGLAVKAGYKVLKSIKPGATREAMDGLLDDFIQALEPFHEKYQESGPKGSFGAFLKKRTAEVAEALVQITDRKAEKSKHKNLVRGYKKLRQTAIKSVKDAVPGLAELLDKYYA